MRHYLLLINRGKVAKKPPRFFRLVKKHDKLIADYLQIHKDSFDSFMLSQVSICSAQKILGEFSSNEQIISMAKLAIKSLGKDQHA